jgi:hypothetical protein
VVLLLFFAVNWGYYLFFELVWHGQTPGKRWLGLRVIKEGGYPIGFTEAAIRNLVRLVDYTLYLGAVVMLTDRLSRRLGDLAAGTLVVKERRELSAATLGSSGVSVPPGSPAVEDPGQAIPNLHRLTPADRALLREYLSRRGSLASAAATALAARLAAVFAGKLDHQLAAEPPESFLVRLARQLGYQQGDATRSSH